MRRVTSSTRSRSLSYDALCGKLSLSLSTRVASTTGTRESTSLLTRSPTPEIRLDVLRQLLSYHDHFDPTISPTVKVNSADISGIKSVEDTHLLFITVNVL